MGKSISVVIRADDVYWL